MADITLLPVPTRNPEVASSPDAATAMADKMGNGVRPEFLSFYAFCVAMARGCPVPEANFRVARTLNVLSPGCMHWDVEQAVFCVHWLRAKEGDLHNGPDYIASQLNAALGEAFPTPEAEEMAASYIVAAAMHSRAILQGQSFTVMQPKVASTVLGLLLRAEVASASKQRAALEDSSPAYDLVPLGTVMESDMFLARVSEVPVPTLRHFASTYGLMGGAVFMADEEVALPCPNTGASDAWEVGEAFAPRLLGITMEALWATYADTSPEAGTTYPLDWFPIADPEGMDPFDGEEE